MQSFISYKKYTQEHVINETYESFRELQILAREIIKSYIEGPVEINKLYPLSELAESIKYNVLKDFIESGVGFYITDDITEGGSYIPFQRYDRSFKDDFIQKDKYKIGIVLINLHYANSRIIIHELEHAWDDYRAKGKLLKTKLGSRYKDRAENVISQNKGGDLLDHSNLRRLYYRTPHELSAYFTQTLERIRFFEEYRAPYKVLRNFKDLYEEFQNIFQGYEYLTPKDKKVLARKFSQYYYKLKNEHENISEE